MTKKYQNEEAGHKQDDKTLLIRYVATLKSLYMCVRSLCQHRFAMLLEKVNMINVCIEELFVLVHKPMKQLVHLYRILRFHLVS
jgi:hypothetical protein